MPRIRRVIDLNSDLLAHVIGAETGQRGFLLTGRPEYLGPYHKATAVIFSELDDLAALVSGDPAQSARIQNLRSLIGIKLAELQHTIELRQAEGLNAALEVAATWDGTPWIASEAPWPTSAGAKRIGGRRLGRTSKTHAQTTRWLTLVGAILLAGLVGIGSVALGRAARRQELLTETAAADRDLLHTTLYSIGDAVIATDLQGDVTFLNPVAERLTGFTAAEARGHPIEHVFNIVQRADARRGGKPGSPGAAGRASGRAGESHRPGVARGTGPSY